MAFKDEGFLFHSDGHPGDLRSSCVELRSSHQRARFAHPQGLCPSHFVGLECLLPFTPANFYLSVIVSTGITSSRKPSWNPYTCSLQPPCPAHTTPVSVLRNHSSLVCLFSSLAWQLSEGSGHGCVSHILMLLMPTKLPCLW